MSQAQDNLVAAASDPNADYTTLHELANNYPGLRPYIAANPRTYPALLEWLGTLGVPEIDAALAQRRNAEQPATPAPADGSTAQLAPLDLSSPQAAPQSAASPYQQPQYQPTQATQATVQYQQADYQQQYQTAAQPAVQYQQAQPVQYQTAAQPAVQYQQSPSTVFGVGEEEDDEEELAPRSSTWLWVLGAITLVCIVALIVWFALSDRNEKRSAPQDNTVATQDASAPATEQTSQAPSPTPSASPTLASPAPAGAIEMSSFTAPSGNITCTLSESAVTCTINEHDFVPTDCTGSKTGPYTVSVATEGDPSGSCGTQFAGTGATLDYGSSAKNKNFACTSDASGIHCWSQVSGKGFTLSRANPR